MKQKQTQSGFMKELTKSFAIFLVIACSALIITAPVSAQEEGYLQEDMIFLQEMDGKEKVDHLKKIKKEFRETLVL